MQAISVINVNVIGSAIEGRGLVNQTLRRLNLAILLLMPVLSESLFTLVRGNFVTLSFSTTGHITPMI